MASNQVVPMTGTNVDQAVVISNMFDDGSIYTARFDFAARDPEEVRAEIRRRKAEATTPEELFGGSETQSSKDKAWQNRPFGLLDVTFAEADLDKYPNSLPIFAVLHVVTLQGEVKVLTSGAESVVQNAALALAKGWVTVRDDGVPSLWLKLTSTKTKSGNDAIDLVSAADAAPFEH